jgi:hypothetical protein
MSSVAEANADTCCANCGVAEVDDSKSQQRDAAATKEYTTNTNKRFGFETSTMGTSTMEHINHGIII